MARATNKSKRQAKAPLATTPDGLSKSLARILRPQAAYRWLLPQLAAITPQYIEMTLRGALAGNHVQAWELFDLMEDTWPHLNKAANELKNAVVEELKGWKVRAYQEEGEPETDSAKERARVVKAALLAMQPEATADENDFGGTVYDLCDAWLKGQVVLEVDWQQRPAGKLGMIVAPRATFWVHPVCYAWDMSGRLGLRLELNGTKGTDETNGTKGELTPGVWSSTTYQPMPSQVAPFPPHKFWVGIAKAKSGTALGAARLRCLAWWWCAANFSADWLLNLAQLFGLPFRWANYDPNAPQATIDSICSMLENMGSAGWAAFPAGTTLDLKDTGKTGDQSPQGDLLDRADRYCDILVLGQTLTTEVGDAGSQALGTVHKSVKDDVVKAVCGYVAGVLNTQAIPSILELNYGDRDEQPCYEPSAEEAGTLGFKRELLKNWSNHATLSAVMANLTDLKQMVRDAGLPVNEEYKDPYVPVTAPAGQLVSGEVLKDSEGDVIGALPEGTADGADPENGDSQSPIDNSQEDKEKAGTGLGDEGLEEEEEDEEDLKGADTKDKLQSNAAEALAQAVAADLAPVRQRLEKILEIQDPELMQGKLREFLAHLDELKADILKDPSTAQALQEILAAGFANGIATKNSK